MAIQKMRIKLKAYDHNLVDQSAARIIETVKKSGAKYSGPIPMPTEKEVITRVACCVIPMQLGIWRWMDMSLSMEVVA